MTQVLGADWKVYRPGEADDDPDLCHSWVRKNEGCHYYDEHFRSYGTFKRAMEMFADEDGLDLKDWQLLVYRCVHVYDVIADNISETDIEEMTVNALDYSGTEIDDFIEEWACKEAYEDFRKTIRPWLKKWMPTGQTYDPNGPVGEVDLSGVNMEEWR